MVQMRRAPRRMLALSARRRPSRLAEDGDFIASLMTPVTSVGEFASWISPPKVGIDNKPGDFEYVKIET